MTNLLTTWNGGPHDGLVILAGVYWFLRDKYPVTSLQEASAICDAQEEVLDLRRELWRTKFGVNP